MARGGACARNLDGIQFFDFTLAMIMKLLALS
jgi:hypothetical protein